MKASPLFVLAVVCAAAPALAFPPGPHLGGRGHRGGHGFGLYGGQALVPDYPPVVEASPPPPAAPVAEAPVYEPVYAPPPLVVPAPPEARPMRPSGPKIIYLRPPRERATPRIIYGAG